VLFHEIQDLSGEAQPFERDFAGGFGNVAGITEFARRTGLERRHVAGGFRTLVQAGRTVQAAG
jgi:hypothetical protein